MTQLTQAQQRLANKAIKAELNEKKAAALWLYLNFIGTLPEIAKMFDFDMKSLENLTLRPFKGDIEEGFYNYDGHQPGYRSRTAEEQARGWSFPDITDLQETVDVFCHHEAYKADPEGYRYNMPKTVYAQKPLAFPASVAKYLKPTPIKRNVNVNKSVGFDQDEKARIAERLKAIEAESDAKHAEWKANYVPSEPKPRRSSSSLMADIMKTNPKRQPMVTFDEDGVEVENNKHFTDEMARRLAKKS